QVNLVGVQSNNRRTGALNSYIRSWDELPAEQRRRRWRVRVPEQRAATFRHRIGDAGNSRGEMAKRACRYSVLSCSRFEARVGGRHRTLGKGRQPVKHARGLLSPWPIVALGSGAVGEELQRPLSGCGTRGNDKLVGRCGAWLKCRLQR